MKLAALLSILAVAGTPHMAIGQVSAEPWFQQGTVMITLEAGGAAFSDFDRSQARPIEADAPGTDFRRRVSARTSGSAGAWATYWLGTTVGLRGGVAWVPSGFTVWNEEVVPTRTVEESPRYASLDIWMAHGAAVFRFPRSFGRVVPYGIVGGGVIRYVASDDASLPPEARDRFEDGDWQTPAALLGIGATLPLQRRNLLLAFELTNHISRAPLAGGRGETFELSGVDMQIDPDPAIGRSGDVGVTSHVRLSFGLTLPLR